MCFNHELTDNTEVQHIMIQETPIYDYQDIGKIHYGKPNLNADFVPWIITKEA